MSWKMITPIQREITAITAPSHPRLCRNSVHGSTGSPRTEYGLLEINYLAVRPEPVEGKRRITKQSLREWGIT